MQLPKKLNNQELSSFSKSWRWILGWGIGFTILGMLAISFAAFTTLLSVVLVGGLILVSGLFILIDTLHCWQGKSDFSLRCWMGVLYSLVGLILIFGPEMSSVALTLALAIFFIIIGIARIFSSTSLKLPKWQWGLVNGIITLLLGILIMAEWPASGLFIIGLFIGIDLILFGWTYVMIALFLKDLNSR
jgi:uncharacterized membrane protein HdeD (DUF308 family)